jgi:glycosyltransferase involved in cell wall biosynthesis
MNRFAGQRVLMLLENASFSSDGRVRREANSLAAAGFRVTVICRRAPGEKWHEEFGPVTAYQYPAPPAVDGFIGYVLEYSYALAATMLLSLWVAMRTGFDVIHAHNPPDLFVLIGGFYRLFGKRFVFDQHDLAPEMYRVRFSSDKSNSLVYRALVFFERLSCRWANQVIAANDSYKRIDVERSGISAEKITVVRNGPEPCHLQISEPEPGLHAGRGTLIGFVGEIGVQDGVDYLLRSLAHLTQDFGHSDWHCVLVGDGDAVPELKRLAAELGIADRLQWTGWLDYRAVPRYIRAMDVCVSPDPSNDYSDRSTIIKLMEYMAQAKPMVVFDLPEHRVTAGESALYARANDEVDFARQIARLIDDVALGDELGRIGRLRVVNNLAWCHQEQRLLSAYEATLAPRSLPHVKSNGEYVRLIQE